MVNLDNGWIKIYRKIRCNWIWQNPEYLKAWIDLLLMVNHEEKQIYFNGHVITIGKGQKLTSLAKLADRWKWTRNRVDRFLRLLDEAEMVTANRTPNGTLLTVEKYGFYQTSWDSYEATDGASHEATGEATGEAQTRMNKNDKEVKNIGRKRPPFIRPTLDEVMAYCEERGNDVDPERFFDYYEARGWELTKGRKMKDWKATVRTWEKNSKKWNKEKHPDNHPGQRKEYEDIVNWGM